MAAISSINSTSSRYAKGGTTLTSGNMLGWWNRKVFPSSVDDITMVIGVKYNQLPHLLAYDVYGQADLAWFILHYNNILDATTEFITGRTIILPLPQRVQLNFL